MMSFHAPSHPYMMLKYGTCTAGSILIISYSMHFNMSSHLKFLPQISIFLSPFVDLIDMLKKHFEQDDQEAADGKALSDDQIYLWIDIFAIQQHRGTEIQKKDQISDLAGLKVVVKLAHQTLMVLDGKGQLLRRVWCLYEAAETAKKSQGKSDLRMLCYDMPLAPIIKVTL